MMPDADATSEPRTVAELQRWGRARLAGTLGGRECELLLGHALQRDRAWLFAHADDRPDAAACASFQQLLTRRVRGEPVAQLLGAWGFWTLDMKITADTLIPRPETELLVEQALARIPADRTCDVVDMGTGSGAIALALAGERPMARIMATDASPAALQVARENAERNRIGGVEFLHGDWYAPLQGRRFDLIVSNPPYLAQDDPHLQQGDLRFEPIAALISGADGLDALRTLSTQARAHLNPGGWILLEHGYAQGAAVRDLLREAGLYQTHTVCDLEHRERVSLGRAG